ncbi:hypothetical protein PPERSA_01784 [Pseudocohnilembus persalinus]|uniref:Serine hydrolase FSH domain-containing protein n=1 Tax=Pseudocohnilembus persalinus TaxID=266149 RepID=A0A0V0R1D1_PSEPJ|nr:hypothetical protein PPERSA_01784 [Pseudocohnilembus persalinus]|eukprot:KRX08323.1 hypothetical protein PPERSA_01784 [Pseudocohnilembus persalinus]
MFSSAGHYALEYQQNVKQLFMISPFGIQDPQSKKDNIQKMIMNDNVIHYVMQDHNEVSKRTDSIMSLPVSSERCMTTLLKFPEMTAFDPLENQINKLNIPVNFYFGENDWMEQDAAKKLINQKLVNGTFNIISNASHNISFQNPEELAHLILKQSKILNEKQQQY